jgi:beta-glucosidase
MDLPSLSLPHNQDAIIAAVAAANPHTVVVLETGSPVTMPWVDAPAAILEAWYAGSDGANALGNVLFGTVNPSGKLPNTFPKSKPTCPTPPSPSHLRRTSMAPSRLRSGPKACHPSRSPTTKA